MDKLPFIKSEIAQKLANYKLPRYDELPAFPIVMRQLVSLLDRYLSIFVVPGEENLLTQSMINSYVYKKVIKAPEHKEYNNKQIIHLLSIGILKQVLSISDVAKLIEMQTNQYPIDVAYNYFCEEVENALKVTFDTRSFADFKNNPKVITPLTESVHSAVLAFANKIYVKQSIYFSEQQN